MKTPGLNALNIFPVRINDLSGDRKGCDYLVYSPLSREIFVKDSDWVKKTEQSIYDKTKFPERDRLIEEIVSSQTKTRDVYAGRTTGEVTKMSILPNYACNFSCSYCYSAKGRSKGKLSEEKAYTAIDYFIDTKRIKTRELWLSVLGGGEPMLSWKLTSRIIRYARERSRALGFKLGIGLTTNGSVINDELIKTILDNYVQLSISFEILEDVQNTQRQEFEKVSQNIKVLMEAGLDITIKPIITPANVERLSDMVSTLHKNLPKIKNVKLQIAEGENVFHNDMAMAKFYQTFTRHFFDARKLAQSYGIDLYCLSSKYVNLLLEHYCGGELCVTPEGTVSMCHRVSSPNEKYYNDFVYGQIKNINEVEIDQGKFQKLIKYDIYNNMKCKNCFVKYHCGGGCLAQSYTYTPKQLDIICDWNRDLTKRLLWNYYTENKTSNTERVKLSVNLNQP